MVPIHCSFTVWITNGLLFIDPICIYVYHGYFLYLGGTAGGMTGFVNGLKGTRELTGPVKRTQ